MERQSTSKLFRVMIAILAFFVLCTSAILFASCGTKTGSCDEHTYDMDNPVSIVEASCGRPGSVTYKCTKCGLEQNVVVSLATGAHEFENDVCKKCGMTRADADLLTKAYFDQQIKTVLDTLTQHTTTLGTLSTLTDEQVKTLVEEIAKTKVTELQKNLTQTLTQELGKLDFDSMTVEDIVAALQNQQSDLYKEVAKLIPNYVQDLKNNLPELLKAGLDEKFDTELMTDLKALLDADIESTLSGITTTLTSMSTLTEAQVKSAIETAVKTQVVIPEAEVTKIANAVYGKVSEALSKLDKSMTEVIAEIVSKLQGTGEGASEVTLVSMKGLLDNILKEVHSDVWGVEAAGEDDDPTEKKPSSMADAVLKIWEMSTAMQKTLGTMQSASGRANEELAQKYAALEEQYNHLKTVLEGADGKSGLVAQVGKIETELENMNTKLAPLYTTLEYIAKNGDTLKEFVQTLKNALAGSFGETGEESGLELLGKALEFFCKNATQENYDKAVKALKDVYHFFGNGTKPEGSVTIKDIMAKLNALTYDGKTEPVEGNHQHQWVLSLVGEYKCTEANTYEWKCALCDVKPTGVDNVTVPATGHVVEYKTGLTAPDHHYAATCVNPAYVEGYCVNCEQYVGEWSSVGAPTYQHHYVLETGTAAPGAGVGPTLSHTCTSVHENVYHCETCGGAYVVETDEEGNLLPDGTVTYHNYYSEIDENGKPTGKALTDERKEEFYKNYAEANGIEAPVEDGKYKDVLTPQQQYEALESYLNKVWDSEATCVEPPLTVVECVDCGVRYAYTYGLPHGHTFVEYNGRDVTCTNDGISPYFYCSDCGYYFAYNEAEAVALEEPAKTVVLTTDQIKQWKEDNAYSKHYVAVDGKVLNGEEDAQAAHDHFTNLPATGHSYVKVYVNIEKCVTAPRYVYVCEKCFTTGKGDTLKTFADLVLKTDKTNESTALFAKVAGKENEYIVYGIGGDETRNTNPVEDDKLVREKVLKEFKNEDTAESKTDLTVDFEELAAGKGEQAAKDLINWLDSHHYLEPGQKDELLDDLRTGLESGELDRNETRSTIIEAMGLNFYYTASNILDGCADADPTHPNGQDPDPLAPPYFMGEIPGHQFNDYFVTVVENCVMYERHVYFCSVCGQGTAEKPKLSYVTDEDGNKIVVNTTPYLVIGDADEYIAGYRSGVKKPEGFKTDLAIEWGNAQDAGLNAAVKFLAKYGYLNDYRKDIKAEVTDDEVATLITALTAVKTEKGEEGALAVEDLAGYFTEKNTLNEFTVKTNEDGSARELGHKFNTVMLLGAEACDAPGHYVYVCSECGLSASTVPTELTYQSGSELVQTGKDLITKDGYHPYTDNQAFRVAVPEERRLAKYEGNEKYGPNFELPDSANDDLQIEWNALLAKEGGVTEQEIFDWLLKKGYLNNVVDTYVMTTLLKVEEGTSVTTAMYTEAFSKLDLEDAGQKAAILALAKQIAKDAGHLDGTGEGEINFFYTRKADKDETAGGNQAAQWNKTTDVAATEIPISGHLYTKADGTLYNEETDPSCLDFASEFLTDSIKAGKYVYWDDTLVDGKVKGWVQVEGKSFNYGKPGEYEDGDLDPTFKEQVEKYGVIAACKRENCPFHVATPVTDNYKGEEPFTAGYVAAKDHEMHYYKYEAYTLETAQEDAKTDSSMLVPDDYVGTPSKVADLSKAYNMKEVAEYDVTAEEIEACNNQTAAEKYLPENVIWTGTAEGKTAATPEQQQAAAKLAAQTKKQLEDQTNLYTMQMIYNTLHLPTADKWPVSAGVESRDTYIFYPDDGPLAAGIKDGSITQDWQPLTKELKPSCWISLRCAWYHFEGEKCNRIEKKNDHTYPKTDDWNYFENLRNCQHGDKCTICGVPTLSGVGKHNLMNVEDILRLDSESTLLKAYNLLKDDPNATWATPIAPTCSETGTKVYICTGELEKYYGAYTGDADAFYASKPVEWKQNVSADDDNYKIETVATTPHSYVTHYYYLSGRYANEEISLEKWNDGFNAAICLYGYYTQDICQNCKRDGRTPCGDIRTTAEPVTAVWQTEDGWKAFYTPQQLVFMQRIVAISNASMQATIDKLQARVDELTAKQSSSSLTEDETKELKAAESNITLFKGWLKTYPESVPTMDPKAVDLWDIDALVKALDKSELLDGEEATTENVKELLESITIEELTAFVAGLKDDQVKAIVGSNSFGSMSPFVAPENITKEGEKVTRAMAVKHEKQDHTLAPVVGYQDLKSYIAPTATSNAKVSQVCVICGFTTQEVYGATEVRDAAGNVIAQYNIATKAQIDAWNAYLDGLGTDTYDYACEIDASDLVIKTDAGKTDHESGTSGNKQYWTEAFPDGHYSYDEETTLAYDGTAEQADKFVGVDLTGTSVVDIAKKLTMSSKNNDGTEQRLDVHGNVTFRGPKEGDKAELDLSGFSQTQITGGTDTVLTFENLKVNLGDSTLFGLAGKVFFRNCEITGDGVLISTNANNAGVWTQITIENSTFKTTGDIAIYTNKYSASITATNSTFEAARIGVAIRIGEGHFTDCTFKINKAQGSIPEWGNGTAIKAQAGLEIGNPQADYASGKIRYATVTLDGDNKFEQNETEVGSEVWSTDVTKIAIFSCTECKSTVTIDSTTKKNVGSDMTNDDQNVELIYKVNADLPATEVATLIESVAAEGGTIVLPVGLGTVEIKSGDVASVLDITKNTTLDLQDNTLVVEKGIDVKAGATLVISGGNIEGAAADATNLITVEAGGAVELNRVTLTVTAGCNYSAEAGTFDATTGIFGAANTKITIANSVIDNPFGYPLATNGNADKGPVTFVLTDSAFISNFDEAGKDCSTSVALVLNNGASTLYAGGCYFYGVNAAAWVRGGEAHFYGCTFASPATPRTLNTDFGVGGGFNKEVAGVLIVGNGKNTIYGNAKVELVDCDVKKVSAEIEDTLPDLSAQTMAASLLENEVKSLKDKYGKDYDGSWFADHATTEAVTAKPMTIVATDTTKTTIEFSDVNTAKQFLGDDLKLVVSENVFFYNNANRGNLEVKYVSSEPTAEEVTYETLTVDETIAEAEIKDKAPKAIEDAAKNGGKIVLEKKVEEPITVDEQLVVPAEKAVEIDLNGNNLTMTDVVKNTQVQGELTISGGTVTVPKINKNSAGGTPCGIAVNGKGAQLTLENTTVVSESAIMPADGGTLIIRDTFIRSNNSMAISTNNLEVDPDATIKIYNSTIASMDQTDGTHEGNGGSVGLLINNPRVKLTAEKSTFYGVCTGAWVRGGEATFDQCTFITGSAVIGNDTWGQGVKSSKAAKAALLVGNGGAAESYGSATVTLTKCTCIVSKEVVELKESKYVVAEGNKVTVDDTQAANAKIVAVEYAGTDDAPAAKKLVLAAYKKSVTTITLDADSATSFGVSEVSAFVKGTNVLCGDGATGESFVVNGKALTLE